MRKAVTRSGRLFEALYRNIYRGIEVSRSAESVVNRIYLNDK